jgi:hypothetical protein
VEDKFSKVLAEAQCAFVVVGDANTGKFSLVPPSLAGVENFLGVVAIVQGRPQSAWVDGLPDPMIDAIAAEFCRLFEAGICELEQVFFKPAN